MTNTVTLSFTLWEVALLIIAIAVVYGTVQLVKVFKNLAATLDSTNKMMEENRAQIKVITENAESLTTEADAMVKIAHETVDTVMDDMVTPILGMAGRAIKLISTINKVGGAKKQKEKKAAKTAKKAA